MFDILLKARKKQIRDKNIFYKKRGRLSSFQLANQPGYEVGGGHYLLFQNLNPRVGPRKSWTDVNDILLYFLKSLTSNIQHNLSIINIYTSIRPINFHLNTTIYNILTFTRKWATSIFKNFHLPTPVCKSHTPSSILGRCTCWWTWWKNSKRFGTCWKWSATWPECMKKWISEWINTKTHGFMESWW